MLKIFHEAFREQPFDGPIEPLVGGRADQILEKVPGMPWSMEGGAKPAEELAELLESDCLEGD
jgi:hypothetical protein